MGVERHVAIDGECLALVVADAAAVGSSVPAGEEIARAFKIAAVAKDGGRRGACIGVLRGIGGDAAAGVTVTVVGDGVVIGFVAFGASAVLVVVGGACAHPHHLVGHVGIAVGVAQPLWVVAVACLQSVGNDDGRFLGIVAAAASTDATGVASVSSSRSTDDIAAVDGYGATAAAGAAADACRPATAVGCYGAAMNADGAYAPAADAGVIPAGDAGDKGSACASVL